MQQGTTSEGVTAPLAASPLLAVRDLAVSFGRQGGERVQAVDGLHVTIHPRQTLALVGESGCGKSVTALSILRLVPCPPGRVDRGEIDFDGRDLLRHSERQMLRLRGRKIAMIFQEPASALNPVMKIGDQIIEAIRLHQPVSQGTARERAADALAEVGIARPAEALKMYPHEFSGGMCQRAMIAMALACEPALLLADEPTTALDVTIQAQILKLLRSLQARHGMSMLLITHDLGVVSETADVVCVMYAGRVVEYARVNSLFDRPAHPYTRALLSCRPRLAGRRRRLLTVTERMDDPAEFRQLPGYQYGVVPWWPEMPPPDLAPPRDARTERDDWLFEVEPEHWVACWRTEYVAGHPRRMPDIELNKSASA